MSRRGRRREKAANITSFTQSASAQNTSTQSEAPNQQEQPAASSGLWSYVSSINNTISNIAKVASPFFTKENIALGVVNNLALPLASGVISRYLLEENEDDSEDVSLIKRALAVAIPVAAMAARSSINSLLSGLLRERIRQDFINKMEKGDVLNLRNHSPHATPGFPALAEVVNLETLKFSLSAIPLTAGMVGNSVELSNLVYNSYRLAGNNAAFITAAMSVLASVLTVKVSSMGNESQKKGWDKDEEVGVKLRSTDANKLQIAGLNAQKYEIRKLQKMIKEREKLRISSSSLEFVSSLINMLLFYSAPQILRSLKSVYPEGITQTQIEEFSAQVLHSMATLGNIIRPLTLNQQQFTTSIDRLLQLHVIMDDVIEFTDEAPLKINYSCGGDSIDFINFRMAKPSEAKHKSLAEKVKASLADDNLSTIRGANLKLESGKTYQLLGESGLGKSSLLKACSGLWPYASGVINFPCSKEEIYFITQEPFMPSRATLLEIMVYPQDVTKIEGGEKEKLAALMKNLGLGERIKDLDDKESKDWSTLSRGEQQRIVLIRMIMQEAKPKLIFMDEATASVDKESASKMYKMIKEYLPAATVIYISHDISKTSDPSDDKAKPSATFEIPSFTDATITINKETGKLSVTELAAKAAKIKGVEGQASHA